MKALRDRFPMVRRGLPNSEDREDGEEEEEEKVEEEDDEEGEEEEVLEDSEDPEGEAEDEEDHGDAKHKRKRDPVVGPSHNRGTRAASAAAAANIPRQRVRGGPDLSHLNPDVRRSGRSFVR